MALHLLAVVGELALELGLALGNEVHAEEEMEPRGLRVGRRPPRGEYAREAPGGAPKKLPAVHRSAAMEKDSNVFQLSAERFFRARGDSRPEMKPTCWGAALMSSRRGKRATRSVQEM